MNHEIHVRTYGTTRATEKKIAADATRYGGSEPDVTDKGAIFTFPTRGSAELFRERVNANYSSAHADWIGE
jgi:hypothetical protein